MREIKFRAWDTIDKEMFGVVMLAQPRGKNYMIVSGRGGSTTTRDGQCILMQSTGLHDKTNKEIFEGDMVKMDSGRIAEICWNENEARWWAYKHDLIKPSKWHSYYSVIGNRYENPELLK